MNHESPTRFLLLGASNLTIGFPLLVENLPRCVTGDCEIFAAAGFGRSYGSHSRFLFRTLPGIIKCGLWDAVGKPDQPKRVRALITDIGNDLPFGYTSEEIAGWVAVCLERLKALNAEIIMTLPPLDSVRELSGWRYKLIRGCFFPRCRIPLETMRDSASDLHARISELGEQTADHVVSLPGDWYGFDPIHIRRRQLPAAWREILSRWSEVNLPNSLRSPAATTKRAIRRSREQVRDVRGTRQHHDQPAIRMPGLTVSLF